MFTKTVFSLLKSVLLVALLSCVCAPLVFAQCGGQISLSTDTLEWNGSQIGMPSQQTIVITNTGADQLCLFNVTSTCPALLASFNPVPIPPFGTSTITVDFIPQLDRWYSATIEIFTSDPNSPRDSVTVFARSCQTALAPGMPILWPPMSPYILQFAIPWDENQEGVEYALQVTKLPENETSFSSIDGNLELYPQWYTVLEWARDGSGAVVGLEASANYELKLLTRDCMGNMSVSVPAFIFMPPEIDEAPIEDFTVHTTTSGGPIELRWDPAVTDAFGTPLPFDGYFIMAGNHPDSIDTHYAVCSSSFITLPVSDSRKLFTVYPNTNGTYWGTSPFYTWPPDNAPLYGLNTVSLRDPANWSEWSSVVIQIDSMGWMVDLLSWAQDDLQRTSGITLAVDFDQYGIGPHMIVATVTDLHGVINTAYKFVNVVQRPYVDFDGSYDPGLRRFNLNATTVVTPVAYLDLWWPTSTVDERYGQFIQFESKAGEESLHIIKPVPILASKILNEENPWPVAQDPKYGVTVDVSAPANFKFVGPNYPASPCCVSVTAVPHKVGNLPAFRATCGAGNDQTRNKCEVVGSFDYVIELSWRQLQYDMSWNIVTRSTKSEVAGNCAGPANARTFQPIQGDKAVVTKNREERTVPPDPGFPFAGSAVDTLKKGSFKDMKSARNEPKTVQIAETKANVPNSEIGSSKISGKQNGQLLASRLVGNFYFKIVVVTACEGVCEKESYVQYDVFCCPTPAPCTAHETLAPALRDAEQNNPNP